MFALISRILNLSGRYKSRIQAAFYYVHFVESILSKIANLHGVYCLGRVC